MVTVDAIMKALRNCFDLELPVNIVDLGLIYDVKLEGDQVYVKMTCTTKNGYEILAEQVKSEVQRVKGVKSVNVEVVWDPAWTKDRMTPELKKRFNA